MRAMSKGGAPPRSVAWGTHVARVVLVDLPRITCWLGHGWRPSERWRRRRCTVARATPRMLRMLEKARPLTSHGTRAARGAFASVLQLGVQFE